MKKLQTSHENKTLARHELRFKRNSRTKVMNSRRRTRDISHDRTLKNTKPTPIRELETLQSEYKAHRKKLYEILARGTAVAVGFEENEANWRVFAAHNFWLKTSARGRPDAYTDLPTALNAVLRFILRAKDGAGRHLADKYTRALRVLIHKNTPLPDIATQLAKRGIEKLAGEAAKLMPQRPASESHDNSAKMNEKVGQKNVRPFRRPAMTASSLLKLGPALNGFPKGTRVRITLLTLGDDIPTGALSRLVKIAPKPQVG